MTFVRSSAGRRGFFSFTLLCNSTEAFAIISSPEPKIETAAQTLHWALRTYRKRIVLAVSFGGIGGLVLLDIALRIDPKLPVFYIDTGLLFPETYAFVDHIGQRYGIVPIAVRPQLSVVEQAQHHGEALWERNPDQCCAMRKVAPQRAFLKDYDAWITGLHRTTLETRKDLGRVMWDAQANVVKISPLAGWSGAELAAYAQANDIPQNPLRAQGYASIGCLPCTRRVAPGEDSRAGRWAGFEKTECGLHGSRSASEG